MFEKVRSGCRHPISPAGFGGLRRNDNADNHAKLDNVRHHLGPDDDRLAASDDPHTKYV